MPKSGSTASSIPSLDQLTPAMRQYHEQKAAAPDALLLFRMGDFYETFYEDAQTAARVLGIALTTRGKDRNGQAVPLAGIPYHALDSYLTKLVRAGLKVAISEQVEDPRQAKGVVKRAVVRIVTPGTLTDDALLDKSADNYLACVCRRQLQIGLAFVELSTGAFWVQNVSEAELLDEMTRLGPAEILLPEISIDADDTLGKMLRASAAENYDKRAISRRPAHLFDPYQAEQILLRHFGVASLQGFGFEGVDASLCAAAVIIDYLAETQKTSLKHILKLTRRYPHDFVWIDQSTWRSLEIERGLRSGTTAGTLLRAVDRTCSSMGGRCLRRWLMAPLRDAKAIRTRQQAVADLRDDPARLDAIRAELKQLADIERITARLGVGRASPRDLVALGKTLRAVARIAELFEQFKPSVHIAGDCLCPFLAERRDAARGQTELAEFLGQALREDAPITLNEGGIIAPGFDAELDRLHSIGADGRDWLARYQAREIERSGISSLKVGYNQVFGYYLEITNTHRDRVPADYVRKQTLKNAERYITDELKQYETQVLTAREQANAREVELFEIVRQRAVEHIPALQNLAAAVSEIDAVAGLAQLADERRYVRPEIVEGPVLEIVDGRHPVLEQTLGENFVPNDARLGVGIEQPATSADNDRPKRKRGAMISEELINVGAGSNDGHNTLVILTGPNMAGKSTYIRQVALLTLLAQTGSYVPAAAMRFSPVDRIFARVGASDEIARGQSTFMVEMTEAANILNNATPNSLVIIDELGRGTSTFDGLALAWAIAEQLAGRIKCLAFFATHYHELTELEHYLAGSVNYNVAVREWEDEVVFLHRIARGPADKSYGVHVAKLAGVGREVVTRSQELLAELEANFSSTSRAPKRAARRTRPADQLLLFKEPTDEIIEEIRRCDPERLTPIEALQTLARWKKTLES
ncbi:MAG: DNA mismatch repair protein MutS [Phycisphaerales bacterium]|nr:DNA mismatch repair protein MutS [Phycisphaerales bacterium]